MGCVPRGVFLAAARSLGAVQAVEAWRQAPYESRPQSICVLMGRRARVPAWLRSSLDRLVGLPLGFNRGERCIAQFAQDVVGAPAELARDREAGAAVVDPSGDLEVIVVVGRAAARGLVGGLEQRPSQELRTLVRKVARCAL